MSRILKYLLTTVLLLAVACGGADAQSRKGRKKEQKEKAPAKEKVTVEEHRSQLMQYFVEGEDTVYIGHELPPARIIERLQKQRGKDWRAYYRLVYNFSKVYPYALVARHMVMEADSTIAADNLRRGKKDKYVSTVQEDLFSAFENPIRGLTLSQGTLLLRLIDREVGKSSYLIIRDYKSNMAAGFFQGVGKLFGIDLKTPYDPEGADRETEELVQIWQAGEFETVYFALFGVKPDIPEIPPEYLD